jgi:group I intron endonuclease
MKQHFIYLTTNLINNKKYIGKHYGEINDNYLGSGTLLKKAIAKYGKENFHREILFISNSAEENSLKEKEFIKIFNAVESKNFYNIHVGGQGGNTTAGWSEEQKTNYSKKLSAKMLGKNNPRYGVKLSEETKNKIRQNRNTSYMKTKEYRQKMSNAIAGEKNGMYGKTHSEESKKLMSEHSKGKTSGNKNGMYGKKGNKALNGKKIYMYDENHKLIKTFNAKTAVLEFLNLKGHTGLNKAIREHTLYKGFYWSVETK